MRGDSPKGLSSRKDASEGQLCPARRPPPPLWAFLGGGIWQTVPLRPPPKGKTEQPPRSLEGLAVTTSLRSLCSWETPTPRQDILTPYWAGWELKPWEKVLANLLLWMEGESCSHPGLPRHVHMLSGGPPVSRAWDTDSKLRPTDSTP